MIKYVKKEDNFCKYYVKYDTETLIAIAVYRNRDGKRYGINVYICAPVIYESSEWSISSYDEFNNKLTVIKTIIV